ncbi:MULTISPECIES: hypothetical protein [unclassified Streptomyces]|uniref:hypothetical protein n=1 Tax=unclassified Streptomyces TaxID=2593676 RepID=UPI00235F4971|nr:hypothetical protein [Streptomyces sp. MMBL 11-1]
MAKAAGTGRGGEDGAGDDAELAALVAEFSFRKTYRPTDDLAEPDELPHGPSGTALGEGAPPARGAGEPDGP